MRTDGDREDRRSDMTKLTVAFLQFCERASNSVVAYCYDIHGLFSWKNRGRAEIFQTASNTAGSRNRSANQVHLALVLLLRQFVQWFIQCARRMRATVYILRANITLRSFFLRYAVGWESEVSIATCYGLNGPGVGSRWEERGEIFRTLSHRPWGPQSPSKMGAGSLSPRVKWPGRGVNHSLPAIAKVKERVEIYLYSHSIPLWQGIVCTSLYS
jgi:hypothetical protein